MQIMCFPLLGGLTRLMAATMFHGVLGNNMKHLVSRIQLSLY